MLSKPEESDDVKEATIRCSKSLCHVLGGPFLVAFLNLFPENVQSSVSLLKYLSSLSSKCIALPVCDIKSVIPMLSFISVLYLREH